MSNNQHTHERIRELVHRITYEGKGRMKDFRGLELSERSAVFNSLSPYVRQEILEQLSVSEAVELLDHLDLTRVHHILSRLKDGRKRRRITERLKNDRHQKIEYFTQFHPQASLSLVHVTYVFLSGGVTIGETAKIIEDYVEHTGKIPEVLVHEDGVLAGEVPLDDLVKERNSNRIGKYARPMRTVLYKEERKAVVQAITEKEHEKTVVIDEDGSVLGLVYSDDVLELFGESPASSLFTFAGVEDSERPFDGILSKVRRRYKWLIVNLGTAFLAAGVVAFFNDTLTAVVLVAVYMPIVAGMGGNAATQTLAVMVRGIAVGEISLRNSKSAIVREAGAGLVNGVIVGGLVALIAVFFNQDPLFGLVAALAVASSLVVAGFFGAFIPLLLRSMGRDPATSATIFITTATDVFGLLILLGLATLILT